MCIRDRGTLWETPKGAATLTQNPPPYDVPTRRDSPALRAACAASPARHFLGDSEGAAALTQNPPPYDVPSRG
eukprot:7279305-Alexandrium_andersonii.AAC.1